MKNSYGIPCNDYYLTPKAQQDRITFRYVSGDAEIPSSCTVRVGDTDPLTGEPVTDVGFFTEYHRLARHQAYENLKATRVDLTPEEKEQYRTEKAAWAEKFEKEHGYRPCRDDVRDALADRWPKTYHQSIQELVSDDGNDKAEIHTDLSIPAEDPFGTDEPDDITCLREVAASLTGRLADVFEAMLVKYDTGKEKITLTSLAKKWGVSVSRIREEEAKIIRMIRKAVEESRNEKD